MLFNIIGYFIFSLVTWTLCAILAKGILSNEIKLSIFDIFHTFRELSRKISSLVILLLKDFIQGVEINNRKLFEKSTADIKKDSTNTLEYPNETNYSFITNSLYAKFDFKDSSDD